MQRRFRTIRLFENSFSFSLLRVYDEGLQIWDQYFLQKSGILMLTKASFSKTHQVLVERLFRFLLLLCNLFSSTFEIVSFRHSLFIPSYG